jgi:hypothetical protein
MQELIRPGCVGQAGKRFARRERLPDFSAALEEAVRRL